jgi:hypothetical protein
MDAEKLGDPEGRSRGYLLNQLRPADERTNEHSQHQEDTTQSREPLVSIVSESGQQGQERPKKLERRHPALTEQCYHGVLGRITKAIMPHTEADPAAVLMQLIIAFGNVIGHSPHFLVEATKHYTNLFGCIVGKTSRSRKGTAWDYVRELFSLIDPTWAQDRIKTGLSSGQGVLWAVRDAINTTEVVREKGKPTGEYVTYISDHGVDDKRLLVSEAEFARALSLMSEKSNVLSSTLRCAWDHGNLGIIVKNDPAVAHGAHISIAAHITHRELRERLGECEFFNGFANRFLWICAKRSKFLPRGSSFNWNELSEQISELKEIVTWAREVGEMERSPEAEELWAERYPDLSAEHDTKFGAATDRSEAQSLRLGMIAALSTRNRIIGTDHLDTAHALWKYCEESALYLFGAPLEEDPRAQKILEALTRAPKGLTRSDLTNLFSRNITARQLDTSLATLLELELITSRTEQTGGREAQRWVPL